MKSIIKIVIGSMIGIMVVISAFYIVSRTKTVAKTSPASSVPNVVAQESATLPAKTLDEILEVKEEGTYSGDKYDKSAVEKKLSEMPKDLTNDQIYKYIIGLVGENYNPFKITFDALKNPDYSQEMLKLDPNAPVDTTGDKLKIEVVLDCSGSMADPVTGGVKMDLAKQAIQSFASKLPQETQVGLRVFGHKGSGAEKDKAYSASQTELVYPFSVYNETTFSSALKTFSPTGWTAIAGALTEAGKDLSPKEEGVKKVIYLVTDGIETCGGDPIATAKTLHDSDIQASINIIGFDVDDAAQKQLQAASTAGGGSYVTVKNQEELKRAFQSEMYGLLWKNLNWVLDAQIQVRSDAQKDSVLLQKNHMTMIGIAQTEQEHLHKANLFLRDSKQITYEQWDYINMSLIHKQRYTELTDYSQRMYNDISTQRMTELDSINSAIHKQQDENDGKIQSEIK